VIAEQRQQIAKHRVAEQQLLRGHRSARVNVSSTVDSLQHRHNIIVNTIKQARPSTRTCVVGRTRFALFLNCPLKTPFLYASCHILPCSCLRHVVFLFSSICHRKLRTNRNFLLCSSPSLHTLVNEFSSNRPFHISVAQMSMRPTDVCLQNPHTSLTLLHIFIGLFDKRVKVARKVDIVPSLVDVRRQPLACVRKQSFGDEIDRRRCAFNIENACFNHKKKLKVKTFRSWHSNQM
jgi:hypothetical protein